MVDTAAKRASVLHVTPLPDGSVDAADRMHVLWLYSGIDAGLPSVGPKNPFYSAYFYSRIVGLEEWNETS